ncbi:prepilin-type N-terminal cleavage/methylation domain-containing protein [Candidatus Azambacteria bacterium]|nr:prepilin-type N-terminal cleavage/methylation domain-containing protein [Candidatus Azambacteria bacterium]MBI3684982.1 prepilin-type N-terminal cleavage/methylation domain-containing protein [Candidatus Azambacteria bacterium]
MKRETPAQRNHFALRVSRFTLHEKGFTILELLLVIAIFAILGVTAVTQLVGFQRNTVIESASKDMVSSLRLAHDRAMLGEDGNVDGAGDSWGIRFANAASDNYQTFFGAAYNSGNVKETEYFSSAITFSSPTEGNNTDVVFTKLSGTTTAATVTVTDGTQSKTITIDASGRISAN